jgi:hypothetical protein
MGLLLKYEGDPNISTKEGTPMHIIIKTDNEQVALYLLDHAKDLDPTIENAEGDNVLFFAARLKANNIFTSILERAIRKPELPLADRAIKALNKIHRNGDHVIHHISREMNVPLYNFLKNHYADLKVDLGIANRDKMTALDIQVY